MGCNCKRSVTQPSRRPKIKKPKDGEKPKLSEQYTDNNNTIYNFYEL